jgi:hypothetical protein
MGAEFSMRRTRYISITLTRTRSKIINRTKNDFYRNCMIREIISINTPVGNHPSIKLKSNINLLRNVHPSYRMDYAQKLFELDKITKKEFETLKLANYARKGLD